MGLGSNEYDYVHVRFVYGIREWDRLITNAYKALRPGGCIEIKEFKFLLEFHDLGVAEKSLLII
jgi:hypothetical protein